jgi:hypothetical protein
MSDVFTYLQNHQESCQKQSNPTKAHIPYMKDRQTKNMKNV